MPNPPFQILYLQCTRRLAVGRAGATVHGVKCGASVSAEVVREDAYVPLSEGGMHIRMARDVVAEAVHEDSDGFGEGCVVRPCVEAVSIGASKPGLDVRCVGHCAVETEEDSVDNSAHRSASWRGYRCEEV